MLVIFFRSLILYLVLLFVIRMMGKRQAGEMQPFELVITLIIANLAVISMENIERPLLYGVISILSLLVFHHFVVLIVKKFLRARHIFEGTPSIIITPDGINFSELKRQKLNLSDLTESIRSLGYFSFDDIAYGIYETNGRFSVLESNEYKNATLYPTTNAAAIPLVLVEEGKINKHTAELIKADEKWILDNLTHTKINSLKEIAVLTIDGNGKMYFQKVGKKINYEIIKVKLEGVSEW